MSELLLIDDDQELCELLTSWLSQEGFQVRACHDGVSARKALADAGIPDFRFHDLRHTFATRLLRKTGNLKLVSRLLGHTTVETTTRYAHVLDGDLQSAMDDFSPLGKTESRRKSRSRA